VTPLSSELVEILVSSKDEYLGSTEISYFLFQIAITLDFTGF
jgi:hypothetical protein